MDSAAGTIGRTFDLFDRLTQETTPEGTVNYTYDNAGRRATLQVAGQAQVAYTYDHADRLTGITQGSASVAFGLDDANRRTSLTLPNGIVVEYGYDDDSRLTGLTYKSGGSAIGTLTYAYDPTGLRTTLGGAWARTNLPSALGSATYDDANQVATYGGVTYSYDANGSLTNDGVRSYTWNARDQLTTLIGPVTGSFAYDAIGRRRAKTIGGMTTKFLYDGLTPVQELSGSTPSANLLTGLGIDEYLSRTDSAGARSYLADALGSTVALADGANVVQTEYAYEPFGASVTSGASTSNTFAFTGREADGTGLIYVRARYLHPALQRFTAEDPLGFGGGGPNVHQYVANNPISLTDPTGLVLVPFIPPGCAPPPSPRTEPWTKRAYRALFCGGPRSVPDLGPAATAQTGPGAAAQAAAMAALAAGRAAGPTLTQLANAAAEFPNKVGFWEWHHIVPQYLGGMANGLRVYIPATYHQQITNAFRQAWGYGQGRLPTAAELQQIMNAVYTRFPLPPGPLR